MSTVARGMVPAGLAVFARGLVNVFVGQGGIAGVGMDAVLPWLFLGFGVTIMEAIAPLGQRFCAQRLHDDMNVRITSDIFEPRREARPGRLPGSCLAHGFEG